MNTGQRHTRIPVHGRIRHPRTHEYQPNTLKIAAHGDLSQFLPIFVPAIATDRDGGSHCGDGHPQARFTKTALFQTIASYWCPMLVPLPNRKQEFMPTENPPINWYALRVTYCREMIVKRRLDACGIESFVPMRYKGDGLRPAAPAHARRRRAQPPVRAHHGGAAAHDRIRPPAAGAHDHGPHDRQHADRSDKQMRDFIAVAGNPDEQHIYLDPDSTELRRGDRVRITGGPAGRRRGRVHAHPRRPSRGVSIAGVMAVATAFIHPSLIEALEPQRKTPAEKPAPHRTAPELRDGDRTPEPATRDRIIMTQPSIKRELRVQERPDALSTYLIAFVTFPTSRACWAWSASDWSISRTTRSATSCSSPRWA